jgi:anthranilate/para-aminobenzoate synthase component I
VRLALSTLCEAERFALLGPGFGSSGRWSWWSDLELAPAPREPADALWLCRYEQSADEAVCLVGHPQEVELVLDVPPVPLRPELDEEGYLDAVGRVRDAIAAGDVYQANLTLRATLGAASGGALLATLCRPATPRFASWLRMPGVGELVSASPELLFARDGRRIRVEPMKGTAAAGERAWLEASEKDRAELAMITDLLRDDLHQLCEPGSVVVAAARRVIELPYAVQTVSDVLGRLRPELSTRALLRRLHPGGSVTGCPRAAACDLIERLERSARGFYCGTLGVVRGREACFALLIRTAERRAAAHAAGEASHPDPDDGWVYGVGGGITWDSDAELELEEARVKLGALG